MMSLMNPDIWDTTKRVHVFSGKVTLLDGYVWNKNTYKLPSNDPTIIYLHHFYTRISIFGNVFGKDLVEKRPHPWQQQRFGFLIATRYKNGKYFHVLKIIACFLS